MVSTLPWSDRLKPLVDGNQKTKSLIQDECDKAHPHISHRPVASATARSHFACWRGGRPVGFNSPRPG